MERSFYVRRNKIGIGVEWSGVFMSVSADHKDPAKVACVYLLEKRFSNNAANVQIVHRQHYNLKLVETHSHVLE